MLPRESLAIITVIIFIIPVVVFIPTFVGSSTSEMSENTYILEETDTQEIGQYIEFTVDSVTASDAEVTIVDRDTGESVTHDIIDGETETFVFSNGDIHVTLSEIHTNQRVVFGVEYPSTFGWDNDETRINEYLPIMVIMSILVVIMGVLMGVIGGDRNAN